MLTVFDLMCNGLRDPYGVTGNIRLSWRLGSNKNGESQTSYRVVVVSLSHGDVVWDSGNVSSDASEARYGGIAGNAGEAFSWFVTVFDSEGQGTQSVPSAFVWGRETDTPHSDKGPQRLGCVWTSDEQETARLECLDACDLRDELWTGLLGLSCVGLNARFVRIAPRFASHLEFAQGSVLLDRGLMVVRWERRDGCIRLKVSLPPGVEGEMCVGDRRKRIASGKHVLEGACPERPAGPVETQGKRGY